MDNLYIAPRTPLEESLVVIWAEVLGLDQIGIHDNFLELGGHSLLAMQIISRVLDTTQVELPLQTLLQASTVAEMAVVITQSQAEKIVPEEMVQMLAELESLSDEEAKRLLGDESRALGKQPLVLLADYYPEVNLPSYAPMRLQFLQWGSRVLLSNGTIYYCPQ